MNLHDLHNAYYFVNVALTSRLQSESSLFSIATYLFRTLFNLLTVFLNIINYAGDRCIERYNEVQLVLTSELEMTVQ